jgi:uncharacterized protein YceK
MTARAIRVALLFAALSTAGCGTAGNLIGAGPGKKVPFGGVRRDVQCLTEVRDGEVTLRTGREWEPLRHEQHLLMVLCAADLPFSLIGDVISWPYTRTYSYINQPNDIPALLVVPPAPPIPVAPAPGSLPMTGSVPGSLPGSLPVPVPATPDNGTPLSDRR